MKIAGLVVGLLSIPGLIVGVAWTVVFYVSQGSLPIASLGTGNLLLSATFFVGGVVFLIVGIVLSTIGRRPRPTT